MWDLNRDPSQYNPTFRTTPCRLKIPLEQPPLRQTSPILGRPLRSFPAGHGDQAGLSHAGPPLLRAACGAAGRGGGAHAAADNGPAGAHAGCTSGHPVVASSWHGRGHPGWFKGLWRLAQGYPCAVPCLVLRGVYRGLTFAQPQSPGQRIGDGGYALGCDSCAVPCGVYRGPLR